MSYEDFTERRGINVMAYIKQSLLGVSRLHTLREIAIAIILGIQIWMVSDNGYFTLLSDCVLHGACASI